jgi:hypothetical protein
MLHPTVGRHGKWKLIANLSAFQKAHPVAHPDPEDFEPDGTWYSMIAFGGALYPMDSNHGELDQVTPVGRISRMNIMCAQFPNTTNSARLTARSRNRAGQVQFRLPVTGGAALPTELTQGGHQPQRLPATGSVGGGRSSRKRSAIAPEGTQRRPDPPLSSSGRGRSLDGIQRHSPKP